MIAVFAVDPGGATGLAWGVFDPALEIGECLRSRTFAGSTTVDGEAGKQIAAIMLAWRAVRTELQTVGVKPESTWFVCEDFIYTGSNVYAGDSASISTALIWGCEGYRMGAAAARGVKVLPTILQTASQAKGFATKERLREWECWVVGREHERSAWQHVAYFLKHYQIQHHL